MPSFSLLSLSRSLSLVSLRVSNCKGPKKSQHTHRVHGKCEQLNKLQAFGRLLMEGSYWIATATCRVPQCLLSYQILPNGPLTTLSARTIEPKTRRTITVLVLRSFPVHGTARRLLMLLLFVRLGKCPNIVGNLLTLISVAFGQAGRIVGLFIGKGLRMIFSKEPSESRGRCAISIQLFNCSTGPPVVVVAVVVFYWPANRNYDNPGNSFNGSLLPFRVAVNLFVNLFDSLSRIECGLY